MKLLARAIILSFSLAFIFVVAAGAQADERASTDETTEAPADTEPPASDEPTTETTAPADDTDTTEATDDEDAEDDGGNGSRNLLILVVAAILIAGIAFLAFRPRGGQGRQSRSAGGGRMTEAPSIALDDRVLGDISWLNDQLSLNLLSAPAEKAAQQWRAERPRIEALTRDCQRLEESTADPIWGALAGEVASLAQTLDTAISARTTADVDPSVTRQSIDLVNRHRSQLSGLATQARRR